MNFDENYFKSLNYTNYMDREDRYKKLADELVIYLECNNFLLDKITFLDYGAAIGFLTNSLKRLNINCDGYDISEWAKLEAKRRYNIDYITYTLKKYDFLIALDVFEHMNDVDIIDCINKFIPDNMILRIPCSTNGGLSYHLQVSNVDPTHINCKDKVEWINFFKRLNFTKFTPLNLYTIYDSSGVLSYLIQK